MRRRDQVAWDALGLAMLDRRPLCAGDDRFVADELAPSDEKEMAELCVLCPLRAACEAYAKQARPEAGIWAGRRWKRNYTRNGESNG